MTTLKIILVLLSNVISLAIPLILSYLKAKKKDTQTTFMASLYQQMIDWISVAEKKYEPWKNLTDKGIGTMKKEDVMNKIQTYCLAHHKEFNAHYWNEQVEKLVDMSNNVNRKSK